MKKLLLILLCVPLIGFGQNLDTLIFINGDTINGTILEVGVDNVKFHYPNEESVNIIKRTTLKRIIYSSGRREIYYENKGDESRNIEPSLLNNKLSFFISGGPSFPSGDIAKSSLPKTASFPGCAKTGWQFQVEFYYEFTKNIDFVFSWDKKLYNVDNQQMENLFSESTRFQYDYWRAQMFSSGILVSYPFNNLDFEIKGLMGIARGWSPQFYYQWNWQEPIESAHFIPEALKSDAGLGICIGTGLRYPIDDYIEISFNLDYSLYKVEFPTHTVYHEYYGTNTAPWTPTSQPSSKINISGLDMSFGIRILI